MASKTTKDHRYTPEEDEWLRSNIRLYRWKELTVRFNEDFNLSIGYDALVAHCIRKLKIKRDKPYTQFVKGKKQDKSSRAPTGYEKTDSSGTVWVKISDDWVPQGTAIAKNPNWKRKADLVWEQHNGAKPEDGLIIFLDKDKTNFSPENLYCVDRKISFMLSKNKWHSTNPDLTLAAIKYAELFYKLKERETP